MNAFKPSQIYLQCTYYHRSKAQITAMTVAPLVGVCEAAASYQYLPVFTRCHHE